MAMSFKNVYIYQYFINQFIKTGVFFILYLSSPRLIKDTDRFNKFWFKL